tara:strand:+ start:13440 stop:13949 length:510 start_codon:yes stop_codon:yes gene_type:complete
MENILDLNNNILSNFIREEDKENFKSKMPIIPKMGKMGILAMIIIGILSIISIILYTYGVFLAFYCSTNLINLLTNLIASLLLPHLHLIYRIARPCNVMVWLSKRVSIILTVILLVLIPTALILLPKNLKDYLALTLSGNAIAGAAFNYPLMALLLVPIMLLMTMIFAF